MIDVFIWGMCAGGFIILAVGKIKGLFRNKKEGVTIDEALNFLQSKGYDVRISNKVK